MRVKKTGGPAANSLASLYSNIHYDYPFGTFFVSFLFFGVIPFVGLYYFPIQLDNNPEKGFDTRDTVYAGPRLTWAGLQPSLLLGSRVVVDVSRNSTTFTSSSSGGEASSNARSRRSKSNQSRLNHFDVNSIHRNGSDSSGSSVWQIQSSTQIFGKTLEKELYSANPNNENGLEFLTSLEAEESRRKRRLIFAQQNQSSIHSFLADFSISQDSIEEREKRSWADDLLSSFSSVACYDDPIPAINYLSQLLIIVPGYEDLYDMRLLGELCALQEELRTELQRFDQHTPYRNVWHIGNFFACLAPESRVNCTFLTSDDVAAVRRDVESCTLHRKAIVNCRRNCESHQSIVQEIENAATNARCDTTCKRAAGVPAHCMSQMMSDLFYRILPKDLMARPLHVNIFLPFYTYSSYRMQGYDVDLAAYTAFERRALAVVNDAHDKFYKLKGMLMDVKRDILFSAALADSRFSLLAAVCVFALIALYSLSLAYSVVVLLQLTLSVTSALAIYRFFNVEFPLLNLTVFVLLISIGSDGAFLLFSGFPDAAVLNRVTFDACLRHTASTMFLTQFSTVVPFFLNILSNVVAFRSFGLFAGLTLITNYALLVSFLPAFLVIQSRYVNPWLVRRLPSSLWYCFPTFSTVHHSTSTTVSTATAAAAAFGSSRKRNASTLTSRDYNSEDEMTHAGVTVVSTGGGYGSRTRFERACATIQSLLHEVLPVVLIQGRLVWILSLTVVVAFATVICATQLRLPQYNPLQLFVGSNPHEYYDNHVERLFYFVSSKVALPLNIRLVWGVDPLRSQDRFDPLRLSAPAASTQFRLTSSRQLRALAEQLRAFRAAPFVQHAQKFWPERYFDWSRNLACEEPNVVCCNMESQHYADTYLDYCMRVSTAQLHTQYNDTPIYHNVTFELVGYTALLPTRLKYSHRYANLSYSFRQFDETFVSRVDELPMWYTTEWYLMSTWFDLQRSIITDSQLSIIVSSLVVLVFAAVLLRWKSICAMITIPSIIVTTTGTVVFFGWEIGVLEGVILVLVVGLSFDYTLHYGAAIPRHGCATHRLRASVRVAILPVSMAALSSIIAGSVMLFAQTHAFFQVAIFLVVSTTVSFIFATFFFLPLYYVFSRVFTRADSSHTSNSKCVECELSQRKSTIDLPMANYHRRGTTTRDHNGTMLHFVEDSRRGERRGERGA